MERIHAYLCSDGSLHANSREWIEHEFHLLLMTCSLNASKEEAAELVDRFKDFEKIWQEFYTDVQYGEGKRLGLVLDRRTLVDIVTPGPPELTPPTTPEPLVVPLTEPIVSMAPLDQPVGVGTGMKLGGALDDVAF